MDLLGLKETDDSVLSRNMDEFDSQFLDDNLANRIEESELISTHKSPVLAVNQTKET